MRYSWLTPEIKVKVLERFKHDISHGFVDAELIPLCHRLNALEGVCSSMSCVGHKQEASAYLQIMIDKDKRNLMDKVINVLGVVNMEVSVKYLPRYGLTFGIEEGLVSYKFTNEYKCSKAERLYLLNAVVTTIEEIFEIKDTSLDDDEIEFDDDDEGETQEAFNKMYEKSKKEL